MSFFLNPILVTNMYNELLFHLWIFHEFSPILYTMIFLWSLNFILNKIVFSFYILMLLTHCPYESIKDRFIYLDLLDMQMLTYFKRFHARVVSKI